jgi:hypothetical protein
LIISSARIQSSLATPAGRARIIGVLKSKVEDPIEILAIVGLLHYMLDLLHDSFILHSGVILHSERVTLDTELGVELLLGLFQGALSACDVVLRPVECLNGTLKSIRRIRSLVRLGVDHDASISLLTQSLHRADY